MNEIEWLGFEHVYFEAAVQHFSDYTTGIPRLLYRLFLILQGWLDFVDFI